MISKRKAMIIGILLIVTTAVLSSILTGAFSAWRDGFVLSGEQYEAWTHYKELEEVKQLVEKNYYEPVDEDSLYSGATKGLVEGLGDKYSAYFTASEFTSRVELYSGSYVGIGVALVIDKTDSLLRVARVYSDTPAAKAGVIEGDKIVAVDGAQVQGMTSDQILSRTRGEKGTSVKIQFKRGEELIDLNMRRDTIVRDQVSWRMLRDNIGYIRVDEFNGNCDERFKEATGDLKGKGAKGLILDLRSNPGGYLESAVKMCDILMPEGLIVSTKPRNSEEKKWNSDAASLGLPVMVLTNEDSASASEITAGALQDSGVGKIVGKKTYGKGIVQTVFSLPGGRGLSLTTSQYYLPKGETIHEKGITPDYEVDLPEEVKTNPAALTDDNDTQLQKALELLAPNPAAQSLKGNSSLEAAA